MVPMKLDKKSLLLYLVTDSRWTTKKSLIEQVRESLEAGVTFLQLREKEMTDKNELATLAKEMKVMAEEYKVPFVINDYVQLASDIDADGVHIGQNDECIIHARGCIGEDKILGVSVQTVEQAKRAQSLGADYLGVGAMFPTGTKGDANEVRVETLRDIISAVSIPVVAIGGIGFGTIKGLESTELDGVAVVSAILAADNIKVATKDLKAICQDLFCK